MCLIKRRKKCTGSKTASLPNVQIGDKDCQPLASSDKSRSLSSSKLKVNVYVRHDLT